LDIEDWPSEGDVARVVAFLRSGTSRRQRHTETCQCCDEKWGAGQMEHDGFTYSIGCWHYLEKHAVWSEGFQRVLEHINQKENKIVKGPIEKNQDDIFDFDFGDEPEFEDMVPPATAVSVERITGYKEVHLNDDGRRVIATNYFGEKSSIAPELWNDNWISITEVPMIKITEGDKVTYALEIETQDDTENLKRTALAKLTDAEKKALGLMR
jgi:hypothetical protein